MNWWIIVPYKLCEKNNTLKSKGGKKWATDKCKKKGKEYIVIQTDI